MKLDHFFFSSGSREALLLPLPSSSPSSTPDILIKCASARASQIRTTDISFTGSRNADSLSADPSAGLTSARKSRTTRADAKFLRSAACVSGYGSTRARLAAGFNEGPRAGPYNASVDRPHERTMKNGNGEKATRCPYPSQSIRLSGRRARARALCSPRAVPRRARGSS